MVRAIGNLLNIATCLRGIIFLFFILVYHRSVQRISKMYEKDKSANATEAAVPPSVNETTTALRRPEALVEKIQHDLESSANKEMDNEDTVYPNGLKDASIMISLDLSIFLVALVRTTLFTPRLNLTPFSRTGQSLLPPFHKLLMSSIL